MNNFLAGHRKAYNWLSMKSKKRWCKTLFRFKSLYDMQTNNICESLNSEVRHARTKLIFTMLESIRRISRDIWTDRRDSINTWRCEIGDNIYAIFFSARNGAKDCIARQNGVDYYQWLLWTCQTKNTVAKGRSSQTYHVNTL